MSSILESVLAQLQGPDLDLVSSSIGANGEAIVAHILGGKEHGDVARGAFKRFF